ARVVESAAKFGPHLFLVFAGASPADALKYVAALRADARYARTPLVYVSSLPPPSTAGLTLVVPDPSDVGDFALRMLKVLQPEVTAGPEPEVVIDLELEEEGLDEIAVVEDIPPQPARVLLVDDDPALIRLFSLVLQKNGFEVLTAPDGEVGLQLALAHRPDAIIADLNMPRLDGWGLLRALRADHRVGETPVIFLSCHDDYRESLRALNAGAQDYIAKGGKLDALVGRIRKLLAPRDAFCAAIAVRQRITAAIQEVGVQWALRTLGDSRATGTLLVTDSFWKIRLDVAAGQPTAVFAEISNHQLDGEQALPPLVVIRSGELRFEPAAPPSGQNLNGDMRSLLDAAAQRNNVNEAAALDRLLTTAGKVEVDESLFQIYEQLGPPSSRGIARMVRQGLTPRQVIAQSDASPMDVEETMKDLVRRRVVRISAQA
ncbi:MAG: response regulator transcription factor, partial [Myxococcales bacterium]